MREFGKIWLSAALAMLTVIGSYRVLFDGIEEAVPASYLRLGDEGNEVATVQEKLNRMGYETGGVTGRYDLQTAAAIRRFQADVGLDPSGTLNAETGFALGLTLTTEEISDYEEERFLASVLDAVCPDAPYLVKVALAGVCLRRQNSTGFPDDLPSVVFGDPVLEKAFTHSFEIEPSVESMKAVRDASQGMSPCPEALYYYQKEDGNDFFLGLKIVFRNGRYVFAVPTDK